MLKTLKNHNLDLALSCSNFFVSLKDKIGSMQFLKERGRLLNKLAVSWLLGYLLPHLLLLNTHVSFFNK